jgi:hypothetical protein
VKLCPRLPPKKRSNGGARARELGDRARFAAARARKKTGQNIRFCMARQSAPAGILRGRNNTKNPERYPIRVERFRPSDFLSANAKGRRRAFGSALSRAE